MSSVKASLTVTLKADDVVVAEVEDPALWQQVLTAINSGSSKFAGQDQPLILPANNSAFDNSASAMSGNGAFIGQFATQLGVEVPVVVGACAPTVDGTFMHLDPHCWEVMKRQLPARGILAVAPLAVPATLLALWFAKANLGIPTQAQAKTVLGTISVNDPNASRSIENTVWLQRRSGGQIVINPAQISQAVKLAKCFCSKDWSSWKGTQA